MVRDSALVLVAAVGLTGCAATGPTAGLPDAGSPAAQTYMAYCGACHSVPHPGRHRSAVWPGIVAMMEQRMRERGMAPPGEPERQAILGYLQAHAR